VNYKAEIIEEHFQDGSAFGCQIQYLKEETPLDTGGALSLLPERPEAPLLVLNGDLLTQFDVGNLIAFHTAGGYRATLGVHEYAHTVPLGVIEMTEDRIIQLREKPTEIWLTNAGIYVFEPDLIARIPQGKPYPLPALLEDCINRQESVGAFRIEKDWIDIGRQRELDRARGQV
jgi:NDP-sugar pyrophosphorylase family protein